MDSRVNSHCGAGPSGRNFAAGSCASGIPLRHGRRSWRIWGVYMRTGAQACATGWASRPAASAASPALSRRNVVATAARCWAATLPPIPALETHPSISSRAPSQSPLPCGSRSRRPIRGVLAAAAASAAAAAAPCPSSSPDGARAIDEQQSAATSHPLSSPCAPLGVIELGEGFSLFISGGGGGGPYLIASCAGAGSAAAANGRGKAAASSTVLGADTGLAGFRAGPGAAHGSAAVTLGGARISALSTPIHDAGSGEALTAAAGGEQVRGGSEDEGRHVSLEHNGSTAQHHGSTAQHHGSTPHGRRGAHEAGPATECPTSAARYQPPASGSSAAASGYLPAAAPAEAAAPAGPAASAESAAAASGAPSFTREAAKQLTRSLRSAVTWRQLRELLAAHGPSLDAIHVLTAARRLREVAPQPGRRVAREQALFRTFMAGFLELCRLYLPDMQPAALAGVLYALAALRCPPPPEWMADWLAAAERRLHQFSPQEVSNSVYALGQLEYDPGRAWLAALCDAAAAHLPAADAASASAAAAAEAAAGEDTDISNVFGDPEHVADIVREAGSGGGAAAADAAAAAAGGGGGGGCAELGFTSQGLSQLLWGLARLGYTPPEACMRGLCAATLAQLPHFTAAGLSNALWGLTTLSYRPPDPWVARVAGACLRLMPTCNSYDLSMSIWALLRLGYTPGGDWLAGFLSASYGQLPSASPEHSARILWGLAKVGLTPPVDWLRRWLSLSYVRLLEAESTTLTTMMWALATLGIRPGRRWVDMLLVAAWEVPLRSFSPPDLVMLLWGLAQCGCLPEEAWMEEFWLVSYKRLPVLSARHQSTLLRAAVSLGQAPSERWLAGHEAVTLARMQEQSPEGLALLSYSYGILERTPSREWFVALYGAAACDGFAGWNAMELERLIWGLAKMAPPPDAAPSSAAAPAGWVDAFLARFAVQMHDASYCNLANVLFALALLGLRPGEDWLVAAADRAAELQEEFGLTTAAKVLWALPRLAPNPPPSSSSAAAEARDGGDGGIAGGREGDGARQQVARLERLMEARMRRMARGPAPARGRSGRQGPRRRAA